MDDKNLSGWNYIVYIIIKNNFKYREFSLKELYSFEPYFRMVYPENFHIKDKLRQVLQNLRDKGFLSFQSRGVYQLTFDEYYVLDEPRAQEEIVYLLSNEAIPEWVKIGRTNSIERRLKELYNTSVPLPFKLETSITTSTIEDSLVLERSIHNIIDTLNPDLRKNTEANRREFFKMSVEKGKSVFSLVNDIIYIGDNKIRPVTLA